MDENSNESLDLNKNENSNENNLISEKNDIQDGNTINSVSTSTDDNENKHFRNEPNIKNVASSPTISTDSAGGGQQQQQQNNNIAKPEEIWIETLTDAGKPYYYHAVTRETTWTKPDGAHIKILQQSKVEMESQKMLPSHQSAPQQLQQHVVQHQPPPQHQVPLFNPPQNSGFSGMPGMPPNFNGAPFSVPPPGFNPNIHPPWSGMPWGSGPPQQQMPPKNLIIKPGVIDPSVISRAAEWSEHRAPDGRPYYFHAGRSESVWEKPQAIRDLEAARLAAHSGGPNQSGIPNPGIPGAGGVLPKQMINPLGGIQVMNSSISTNMDTNSTDGAKKGKKNKQDSEIAKNEEKEKNKQQAVVDKSRPVSSTPITGTPWCVVWTGDGRVFFYNPSTKTSVWERPAELQERPDVDKAVANGPKTVQSIPENNNSNNKIPILTNTTIVETKELKRNEMENKIEVEVPIKKAKIEPKTEKPVDVTKEAAMEAEQRAAKERALVPLEQRVKSFKEMLREKDVSAFSTWEKELHKIVFDPRYLLLTSRERKQIFEKYVKDRAEEERKEKRNKMRQKRENFRDLLSACNLHSKSSYVEFVQKYSKDDKFKAIEKSKERESLFNEYILEVRKKEREEKLHQKEIIKKKFMDMLKENKDITRHSRWLDVKKKFENDSRYRAIESSFQKEEYFLDYIDILKDERKKNKDKDKDKDKDKEKEKEKTKESKKKSKEKRSKSKDKTPNKNEINTDSAKSDDEEKKQKERDRQLRAEQSIKEREKEVQRSLANHLRDRDKEREHHKRDEAVRHFNALLADLVRNPDLNWKEVKRQLKKDHRWELVENLDRETRERIFNEHIEALIRKKRDNFREMIDELSLELTASWKDIKKLIKNDTRYLKYTNSERCEREFKDYVRDKTILAKSALRELLSECKLITHKTFEIVQENSNHLKEIEEILKNDRRFLILNHMDHERSQIILTYLEDLHKKGPPPPVTATESTRRNSINSSKKKSLNEHEKKM